MNVTQTFLENNLIELKGSNSTGRKAYFVIKKNDLDMTLLKYNLKVNLIVKIKK